MAVKFWVFLSFHLIDDYHPILHQSASWWQDDEKQHYEEKKVQEGKGKEGTNRAIDSTYQRSILAPFLKLKHL